MMNYARVYKQKGVKYICDPGQSLTAWEKVALTDWIEGSHILITNDYELELVMKITGLTKGDLLEKTSFLITTLGEQGAIITSKEGEVKIPAAKVTKVSDPTGAGDAFRSGLIKGIVTGKDLNTAAKIGAVAAAYAIEHYGTQEHYYTVEEFTKRYEENFGKLGD